MSATLNKEGLSEDTVDKSNINAKETTDLAAHITHTRVTGTRLVALLKFCLDVCIYGNPAAPIPTKKSDIPNIRIISQGPADTEFTIVLPAGTQQIILKDRAGGAGSLFRVSSSTGGDYFTMPENASLHWDNLNLLNDRTLYCETSAAGRILELWEWT